MDAPQFSRAVLEETARQFTVCPFELGLDLSAWCDVVIGDYNYLFDPVVRLHRFFDSAGDWLFLIDEAHNLPDRARAMYSAQFSKSSLTEAKRTLGKGKSPLKAALTRADKAFLETRKQTAEQGGTAFLQELPAELLKPLHALQAPLQDWLEQNPTPRLMPSFSTSISQCRTSPARPSGTTSTSSPSCRPTAAT